MRITVECKVGQAITVSIDDENLVNHIGFVEEKPIEQETCKWKKVPSSHGFIISPHVYGCAFEYYHFVDRPFCPICGKKIKVIE